MIKEILQKMDNVIAWKDIMTMALCVNSALKYAKPVVEADLINAKVVLKKIIL